MRRIVAHIAGFATLLGVVVAVYATAQTSASGAVIQSQALAWGLNSSGQLGTGTTTTTATPSAVALPAGAHISAASAGPTHSLALTTSGAVYAWGDNAHGELGRGATGGSAAPSVVSFPAGTTITAVQAGSANSFALTSTGSVYAWGLNNTGQLGIGSISNALSPTLVSMPTGTVVKALSAGFSHELALTSTGEVYAWGSDGSGQLGDGGTIPSVLPGEVHLPAGTTVSQVSAGYLDSLAVTSTGGVLAWGDNSEGQLGDGSTTTRTLPVTITVPAAVKSVSAGFLHSAAVTTSGTVLTWGRNTSGQLGNGTTTTRSTSPVTATLPAGVIAKASNAQYATTFALTSAGAIYAWGANNTGQLGVGAIGGTSSSPVAVHLPAGTPATSIASNAYAASMVVAVTSTAGTTPTVTVTSSANPAPQHQSVTFTATVSPNDANGTVSFFADGSATAIGGCTGLALNQVGANATATCADSALAPGTHPITASYSGDSLYTPATGSLSGGQSIVAAPAASGTVQGWGYNHTGQLGNGSTTSSAVPVAASLPSGVAITAVSAGFSHSLAVSTTGKVYAWGDNGNGELGTGTTSTTPVKSPVAITLPGNPVVTAVAAGYQDSFALTSTGAVYAWGLNGVGELGIGTTVDAHAPTLVTLPVGVVATAISAGFAHTLALSSSGAVYGWGANNNGQLGDGTTASSSTAVAAQLPAGVVATGVSAGYLHSLAVTSTGGALAWGDNSRGELGNASTTSSPLPTAVSLPGVSVKQVSAGFATSAAVTNAGHVLAWGANTNGELGNGSTATMSATPVTVILPAGVLASAVTAEYSSDAALTSTGAIYAWGDNSLGQLGDASTTGSSTPVAVHLPAGTAAHAIGGSSFAASTLAVVS